ncbi:hypothetical protein DH2020_039784 [Rehmannia glutinosa]|uniref:Late embryogenesis abundant protein LEA-2 subgroup domain-containing protein n=1 Tax=Rehmannia glutinosa TaxID=99300 RepID=A0ABR0UW08_REHGL
MLILMIVLIGSMCMMSLVMWFLYGTYIPEFEISSLRVTNFTATNAALTGTWIAKMVVRNTNLDMAIDFERVRSVVMYRGNILGVSSLRPFEIERNERFDLDFDVPAGDNNETLILDSLPGWVMPALAQDWNNGVVVFSLRLAMSANFSSINRGYREESLIVSCDNLEMTSSPERNEGKLSAGVGSQCLISL